MNANILTPICFFILSSIFSSQLHALDSRNLELALTTHKEILNLYTTPLTKGRQTLTPSELTQVTAKFHELSAISDTIIREFGPNSNEKCTQAIDKFKSDTISELDSLLLAPSELASIIMGKGIQLSTKISQGLSFLNINYCRD